MTQNIIFSVANIITFDIRMSDEVNSILNQTNSTHDEGTHTKPVLFFDIDHPYYFSISPIILHQIVTSVDIFLGDIWVLQINHI